MSHKATNECLHFEQVLTAELREVEISRQSRLENSAEPDGNPEDRPAREKPVDPYQTACEMKLAGLAFSGGGIRSATFNLGILQGLARIGLLRRFDYLSTVSGGGYIGSWLLAWIKRERSLMAVDEKLRCQHESGADYQEPDPIALLRKYSNYLTPRMGLLTADTWTLVAIYLRNLTLNLLTITAFFLALFLLPYLAVWYASIFVAPLKGTADFLFHGALWCLGIGVFFISLNQAYWSIKKQHPSDKIDYPWYARQGGILAFVVLPIMLSTLCAGLWLWHLATVSDGLTYGYGGFFLVPVIAGWLAGSLVAYMHANAELSEETTKSGMLKSAVRETFYLVGEQLKESIRPASRLKTGTFLFFAVLSVFIGCMLLVALFSLFQAWTEKTSWLWYATAFGPPLVAVVYMAMGTLLIGLMGRLMPDDSREWWSRLGGWLIICSALWTVLCTIAFFSLPVIAKATALVSFGWIGSTVAGVLLGKSPLTGGKGSKKWFDVLATVLPSLFVVGLLMFLSFLTSSILILTNQPWDPDLRTLMWKMIWVDKLPLQGLVATNFFIMNTTLNVWLAVLFIASLIAATLLSWRIDINQFSIHLLYRNRLMRAYLGASNKDRQSQPFTGFDPNDDLPLSELRAGGTGPAAAYHGPYPIVNTALNLAKGKQLAWQTRKAASFMFTPLYSGYESSSANDPAKKGCCYRPTAACAKPDGISLATVMAISGAAASPNMGYHSSPPLAFLMTVFNVRLGWWGGNPRYPNEWEKAGPAFGLWYLLKELFGLTDDEAGFVYLSDGGHFENLGIYELVKRRCRFIIACDAGQDEGMKFDDLGNALRKIRIDLGVDITLDVAAIRERKKHCALGRIIYRTHDGREEYGDLLYIKASLCNQEPVDVRNYKALHKEFPHQTTADQWFDEDQFESYRMLGLHTILEMCERWDGGDMEALVKKVEQYIEKS